MFGFNVAAPEFFVGEKLASRGGGKTFKNAKNGWLIFTIFPSDWGKWRAEPPTGGGEMPPCHHWDSA